MANFTALKDKIFDTDDANGYLERDLALKEIAAELGDESAPDYYATAFSMLLDRVSTPVDDEDIIIGRVPEAPPAPELVESPNKFFQSSPDVRVRLSGHMGLDYGRLLKLGLSGILREVQEGAAKAGDTKSQEFARNAEIVVSAIRRFASRYARQAEAQGKTRAARALDRVPYEPAYDFFSALQSIWFIHMIESCYVGARDYSFGKMDDYMLPYYLEELDRGTSREEIIGLLAALFIKANEICGLCTFFYKIKPILPQSSKQYVNIGGPNPNAFSFAVLDAAELSAMAQPSFIVLLKPEADPAFTDRVYLSMTRITDNVQLYNYDLMKTSLINKGIPEEVAADYTLSACCTLDFNHRTVRIEQYINTVGIFSDTLRGGHYDSAQAVMSAYTENVRAALKAYADRLIQYGSMVDRGDGVLDCLLIGDCVRRLRYPMDGGMEYYLSNIFFSGYATIGDSLAALDKMVFKGKRYTYDEFIRILDADFAGHEALRLELLNMTKYGNDSEVDDYSVNVVNMYFDLIDELRLPEHWYAVGGIYSLHRDNTLAFDIPATPDGRKAGEAYSENQSPAYGADKSGMTALLNSMVKLPFHRTANGGLNITFTHKVEPDILKALFNTYFSMGGLHVGINMLDKALLREAMAQPEKHKSLTVRLFGFSEYFVSLPDWQQTAVLNRTAY